MKNIIWVTECGDIMECEMCENFIDGDKFKLDCLACRHVYGVHSDEDVEYMDYPKADLFVRKSVLMEYNNESD